VLEGITLGSGNKLDATGAGASPQRRKSRGGGRLGRQETRNELADAGARTLQAAPGRVITGSPTGGPAKPSFGFTAPEEPPKNPA